MNNYDKKTNLLKMLMKDPESKEEEYIPFRQMVKDNGPQGVVAIDNLEDASAGCEDTSVLFTKQVRMNL